MRLSQYFLPVLREDPAGAETASHRLMVRAGMVRQTAAGIYLWLPMGLRVLRRIETIVREEMDAAGANEMLMPTIQSADLWQLSGRYDDYGSEMLRLKDRHDREMLYGPTNEEQITDLIAKSVASHKALPLNLYHIQWKFRDELRPRFGVMRGREFLMKDAYSFDIDVEAGRRAYGRMFVAYLNLFARIGIKAFPMKADTGPIGGDLSHEFLVMAPSGESEVWCDRALLETPSPGRDYSDKAVAEAMAAWTKPYAYADAMHDPARFAKETPAERQVHGRGIEVGHVFFFGDKYSKPLGAKVAGADGVDRPVQCGSYGVGISRMVGAVIEASHDTRGIVWPKEVAPFQVAMARLGPAGSAAATLADDLAARLQAAGVETLYDDSDDPAGAKFARMDLIGAPLQAVVGTRLAKAGRMEHRPRAGGLAWHESSVEDFIAHARASRG